MASRVVSEGVVQLNGVNYSSWASFQTALKAADIPVGEWVKSNPNKAAALGAGMNAKGKVSTGQNAVRWNKETNSIVGGQLVNRGGLATDRVDGSGRIYSDQELASLQANIDQGNQAGIDKATIDAGNIDRGFIDDIVAKMTDPLDDRFAVLEGRRATDAAADFVNAIVDFGLAEGFDIGTIISQMAPSVQEILNDSFGGAGGIMNLIQQNGDLSVLSEINRAMEHLEANKESIIRDFDIGSGRLSRDLGLGNGRLDTLNQRALRNIADDAASRGLARSGIRNRFEREQGEDHEFASTEFNNAISDAQVDLKNRTDDAVRGTDFNINELGVDKGRATRDFNRAVQTGLLGPDSTFQRGEDDAIFNQSQLFAQIGRDVNSQFGDLDPTAPILPDPITLESSGAALGTGSGFGSGGAPGPAGDAFSGATDSFSFFGTTFGPGGENTTKDFQRMFNTKQKKRKNPIKLDDFLADHPTIGGFF